MQVLTDAKVSTYFSWNRDADDRSQLTLIIQAIGATLAYEDSFRESAVLALSAEEAQALGADLLKLVPTSNGVVSYQERDGASTNRVDQESGLIIRVTHNTEVIHTAMGYAWKSAGPTTPRSSAWTSTHILRTTLQTVLGHAAFGN